MCLARPVVGVLPQDDHAHFFVGGVLEAGEDLGFFGEDGVLGAFLGDELRHRLEIGFLQFVRQHRAPIFGECDKHGLILHLGES